MMVQFLPVNRQRQFPEVPYHSLFQHCQCPLLISDVWGGNWCVLWESCERSGNTLYKYSDFFFFGAFIYSYSSSCLFVRLSVRAYQLPLYVFSPNLILESLIKICRENPNFLIIGKISGTVHEDLSESYFCRLRKITIEAMSSSEVVSGC